MRWFWGALCALGAGLISYLGLRRAIVPRDEPAAPAPRHVPDPAAPRRAEEELARQQDEARAEGEEAVADIVNASDLEVTEQYRELARAWARTKPN